MLGSGLGGCVVRGAWCRQVPGGHPGLCSLPTLQRGAVLGDLPALSPWVWLLGWGAGEGAWAALRERRGGTGWRRSR